MAERRTALVTGVNKGIGYEVAIRLATLDADGPTAGFFNDRGPEAW